MLTPRAQALDAALRTIKAGPKLGALPTLWLHGEDDQLVPLTETRRGIETLEFTDVEEVIYPQAGHEIFNETNKDEVLTKQDRLLHRQGHRLSELRIRPRLGVGSISKGGSRATAARTRGPQVGG